MSSIYVSVWIMITAIIEPGIPMGLTNAEGQDVTNYSTTFFSNEHECEEALFVQFDNIEIYEFRRNIGGRLQAVRLKESDVVQCVELLIPTEFAEEVINLPAEHLGWKRNQ